MNELSGALPALLKEFGGRAELREAVIFGAWRKIAGETLRDQTAPLRLDNKRLIVAVESEMWQRHLEALSGQMIFKLNSALSSAEVTFIEFVVDEKAVKEEFSRRAGRRLSDEEAAEAAAAEITEKLKRSAEVIGNEELRERFLAAAGMCLARKRTLGGRE